MDPDDDTGSAKVLRNIKNNVWRKTAYSYQTGNYQIFLWIWGMAKNTLLLIASKEFKGK